MKSKTHTIVLDAGTTGVKAFIFDEQENVIAKANRILSKSFPKPGWVEQDPKEIIMAVRDVMREAVQKSQISISQLTGMGIATQRETSIAWDKQTSEAIYPAIVWQDTRTAEWCKALPATSHRLVQEKTGLPLDPYFSASKISWLLKNTPQAQELVAKNQLAVGTVDSWLLWNLAEGSPHLTDYTNASRTLLFNSKTLQWDTELLSIFDIPRSILPDVKPSISRFGMLKKDMIGIALPIVAVAGDQQASLFAAGTAIGTTKTTYGTGTFVMQILGSEFVLHQPFFTTLAINKQQPWYALEAKATSGVENGDEILHTPNLLEQHLEKLVESANVSIKQLPHQPKEIVIDGGWIRDGKILPLQQMVSPIPIREQKIYDGTALGIHRMIQ
ncbi:MAG: FGGY family carbohydrate kinase [Patescibacteria group bacterium]